MATPEENQIDSYAYENGMSNILPKGWHSNIFCTPIFILGQDESQGTTTEKAGGQKSNCLLDGQESTLHFR